MYTYTAFYTTATNFENNSHFITDTITCILNYSSDALTASQTAR